MRGEIDYMMETDGGAESERLWREAYVRCTTLETDEIGRASCRERV